MEYREEYFSVAVVKHFHAKDAEFLTDYFAPRCARYFIFTFGLSKMLQSSNSIQFFEYSKGALVRQKTLVREQIAGFYLRYIQLVFWFVVFAVFFLPRRTWILTMHPPACVLQSVVRLLKRHKYALILSEVFQYDLERLSGRLMNWLLNKEARSVECLIYVSAAIEEHHDALFGQQPGRSRCIRKRWTGGIKRRFSREALTARAHAAGNSPILTVGYIGLVRPFCGLGRLVEFLEGHPEVRLDVVGEAHVETLREDCRRRGVEGRVTFRGFLPIDEVVGVAANWFCGTMLFDVTGDVYARYGEPGKARSYLSLGLPILMTDISHLADEIRKFHAGVVLPTNDVAQIEAGIDDLKRNYAAYINGVTAMTDFYEYETKYDRDFEFMRPDRMATSSVRAM